METGLLWVLLLPRPSELQTPQQRLLGGLQPHLGGPTGPHWWSGDELPRFGGAKGLQNQQWVPLGGGAAHAARQRGLSKGTRAGCHHPELRKERQALPSPPLSRRSPRGPFHSSPPHPSSTARSHQLDAAGGDGAGGDPRARQVEKLLVGKGGRDRPLGQGPPAGAAAGDQEPLVKGGSDRLLLRSVTVWPFCPQIAGFWVVAPAQTLILKLLVPAKRFGDFCTDYDRTRQRGRSSFSASNQTNPTARRQNPNKSFCFFTNFTLFRA